MKEFKYFQIRFYEKLGKPDCPYLERWVINLGLFAIRLHHWIASDDQRYFHDHPWDFLVVILKGGYTDKSPGKYDTLKIGSIRFRKAEHKHTVKVNPGGCWSLLITGPKIRNWGFWLPGRTTIMRPLRYFNRYGHHPCEK